MLNKRYRSEEFARLGVHWDWIRFLWVLQLSGRGWIDISFRFGRSAWVWTLSTKNRRELLETLLVMIHDDARARLLCSSMLLHTVRGYVQAVENTNPLQLGQITPGRASAPRAEDSHIRPINDTGPAEVYRNLTAPHSKGSRPPAELPQTLVVAQLSLEIRIDADHC